MNEQSSPHFEEIFESFETQRKWLLSLITDPSGSRYFKVKTKAQQLNEFQEQLDRTQSFLNFAQNPQSQFNSIHVAGTSGKGSVVTMLAAILTASGLNTGYHISPYLQVINEKLVINNQMIAPTDFIHLVKEFKSLYSDWAGSGGEFESLKYGEAWVALTYLWLAGRQVDWAVIETGLGGRYDPTNILPSKLAVLTNINYDHVGSLGPELTDIAWHKAGIIKAGSLAVTAERNPDVLQVFQNEAKERDVPLFCLDKDFTYRVKKMDSSGALIEIDGPFNSYGDVAIKMQGSFQPVNAALAVAAADLLREKYSLPITVSSVREALRELVFAGRMEIMQEEPLVMIDGAHNRHKVQSLVESLKSLYPNKKITVVLGMLSTKDSNGMVEELAPIVSRWIATQPHVYGKPSTTAEELAAVIKDHAPDAKIQQIENVQEGVKLALSHAGNEDMVLVTGSLYMIGDAREIWLPARDILRGLEQNR